VSKSRSRKFPGLASRYKRAAAAAAAAIYPRDPRRYDIPDQDSARGRGSAEGERSLAEAVPLLARD